MKIESIDDAIEFRRQIETACFNLDDRSASMSPGLYSDMKYDGAAVQAGTRVNHNGILYKAAVTLWDTEANNPDNAPTLWEELKYHNGIRIIPEVITVTTMFAKDEKGYWEADGKVYISKNDNNVHTPAQYPDGWEVVE